MSDEPSRKLLPGGSGGIFHDLTQRIKLILRLMGDRRVNPLLKLLPIGALIYLIVPDLVLGPFDDAALIWLGAYLFIELCPPEIVQEHWDELTSVIEGEFREVSDLDELEGD